MAKGEKSGKVRHSFFAPNELVGTNVKQRIGITTLVLGRRSNLKRTTSQPESNRILFLATTQENPVFVNITFEILLPGIASCSTLGLRLRNPLTRLNADTHYCSCDNLSQINGVVACITHRGRRAWYQLLNSSQECSHYARLANLNAPRYQEMLSIALRSPG